MKRPEDSDSDDDFDQAKRPRMDGFGAGNNDSADFQLEAMLAANSPFAKGLGKGKLKGVDFGGQSKGLDPNEPRVQTTAMDFSKLSRDVDPTVVEVQRELVEYLMTTEHRKLLMEETGANVEWAPGEAKVLLTGSAEQVKKAQRLLARVMMHCRWGYSEAKVRRLLKPRGVESVKLRLSPMNTLRPFQKSLSSSAPVLTIGKEKTNDAVINDALISRQHCLLELDEDRGAVYILDCSTNGTFLNGTRLPSKTVGKVMLSHGDEVLLKDPGGGDQEFGYIVNIEELHVREEVKLEAPRRLLTADEMSSIGRDFS